MNRAVVTTDFNARDARRRHAADRHRVVARRDRAVANPSFADIARESWVRAVDNGNSGYATGIAVAFAADNAFPDTVADKPAKARDGPLPDIHGHAHDANRRGVAPNHGPSVPPSGARHHRPSL